MTKEDYNWWENPKNDEIIGLPISVVKDGRWWVAACNDETRKFLGDKLHGCAQGKTKEEAIDKMFMMIRMVHDYSEEERLNYQRFVPFRKGDWKRAGGKWLVIFGIHIYFRYGNGMKGGVYLPFTELNISSSSDWAEYRKFKDKQLSHGRIL
jgi:hypothetical protein